MTLLKIIISSTLISLCSIIGIITLSLNKKLLRKILLALVSLSAGTMMGGAFLHLIPEASEKLSIENISLLILVSFSLFFIIEKILHWRHCHKENCEVHTFGYMNLIGNGIHNFTDGLILAAAFLVSTKLGIISFIAIALHEIPQEISDFGILIYSKFSRKKALIYNFLAAATIIPGGIIGYYISTHIENLVTYFLPLAAGGFIYIAASDLIPEIRSEKKLSKSFLNFSIFILGNLIMYLLTFLGLE